MNDEQVKEFESKLPAALKPECKVRFWREDRGQLVCYEIRCANHKPPVQGETNVLFLRSSHDVEINVRAIANALPASWRAVLPGGIERAMVT